MVSKTFVITHQLNINELIMFLFSIIKAKNSLSGDDHREAKILISIVVVFVVCQSFTIVADIYEAVICIQQNVKQSMCTSNDHIENIIDIAHFMLSINSSINFLLYAAQDKIFRDALIKVNLFEIN